MTLTWNSWLKWRLEADAAPEEVERRLWADLPLHLHNSGRAAAGPNVAEWAFALEGMVPKHT
ncbi:hypothetical protein [Paracoccus aestuariivivens]|uniref:Uncharacterized protein n=1 Tax=Paracoccus aestuariivivens TaxID=1820333 RepID=A0A6L6JHJ8_9RHOB|nr:hypothetical protein [Paracoccus aestuariivivens]MTH80179.1 hypothetical protein [Paracoccus aestuariivivens]